MTKPSREKKTSSGDFTEKKGSFCFMYITLNFWLGGKKWQKGNICVGTEKKGPNGGKEFIFQP